VVEKGMRSGVMEAGEAEDEGRRVKVVVVVR